MHNLTVCTGLDGILTETVVLFIVLGCVVCLRDWIETVFFRWHIYHLISF